MVLKAYKMYNRYFEANKELWNKRTTVHKDSSFYDVASLRAGKSSLTPIELKELGNVKGQRLLHLQCHFGMDTLSWAREGAEVTGIDFSDEAIAEARKLNDELGLNAKFICSNIYDLHPENQNVRKVSPPAGGGDLEGAGAFDIVFTSYGVIGWLPDLNKWAEIISYYLKPGGIFYMAEFHPVVWIFDDDFKEIVYCYEKRDVIETESQGTYTDRYADIQAKEYGWNHSISEVLNALIDSGLQIEFFNEYMYSPYPCFNNVVQNKDGNLPTGQARWWIKGLEDKIPMVYSVKAEKLK